MGVLKAQVAPGVWEPVSPANYGEVFIGPSDPGMTYDLWYDTDEPGTDFARGVIKRVELDTVTVAASTTAVVPMIGGPFTVAMVSGRLYRISLQMRAMRNSGAALIQGFFQLKDGAAAYLNQCYCTVPNGWQGYFISQLAVGDGVTRTLTVEYTQGAGNSITISGTGNWLCVEDIGAAV